MKRLSIIPNLLTIGNAVCGFTAIVKVANVQIVAGEITNPQNLRDAAICLFLAMIFDALDGRVARLMKITSDFGGQLDSLCDAISFGLAPAVMVAIMNSAWNHDTFWARMSWMFSLAYCCGALLRLARFNVENDHDESSHYFFKGLPSPAAAGVVASLVLLQDFIRSGRGAPVKGLVQGDFLTRAADGIAFLLPFCALALAYLMVSRHRYTHVINRYLRRRGKFEYLVFVIFGGILVFALPEITLAALFVGYALTGPLGKLRRRSVAPAPVLEPVVGENGPEEIPA